MQLPKVQHGDSFILCAHVFKWLRVWQHSALRDWHENPLVTLSRVCGVLWSTTGLSAVCWNWDSLIRPERGGGTVIKRLVSDLAVKWIKIIEHTARGMSHHISNIQFNSVLCLSSRQQPLRKPQKCLCQHLSQLPVCPQVSMNLSAFSYGFVLRQLTGFFLALIGHLGGDYAWRRCWSVYSKRNLIRQKSMHFSEYFWSHNRPKCLLCLSHFGAGDFFLWLWLKPLWGAPKNCLCRKNPV